MAKFTIHDIFSGNEYNVMESAIADYFKNGRPIEYDERTWIDLLIVKHTIKTMEKMKEEGDSVSTMFDGESSSSYVRWDNDDNA